jgi:hypothetical protein
LFLHCASTSAESPTAVVQQYLDSKTREQALSVFAPEYRLWFGSRTGEGLDREKVAKMLEWDYALNPRHRVEELTVNSSAVTARVHEDNDFSLLIGFPGWTATSTYTIDENGRIASQVYVPMAGQPEWRPYLDAPLVWLRQHHPDALARIFPNGKLELTSTDTGLIHHLYALVSVTNKRTQLVTAIPSH